MNGIKPKKNLLIIVNVILLIAVVAALIVTAQNAGGKSNEIHLTTAVVAEDGEITTPSQESTLYIIRDGNYSLDIDWDGPEEIGFASVLTIADEDGDLVYFASGDAVHSGTKVHLNKGKYTCTISFIGNEEEYSIYMVNKDGLVDEKINFQPDGSWPMNYSIAFHKRLIDSVALSIVLATIAAILICSLIYLVTKLNDKLINEYDERQELLRGRAYRLAFIVMASFFGCVALLNLIGVNIPADKYIVDVMGVAIGLAVMTTVRIVNDAYFALNENSRLLIPILCLITLANTIAAIINTISGNVIADGVLTAGFLNVIVSVYLLYMLTLILVKSKMNKSED